MISAIQSHALTKQRVWIRADLDVPMADGQIIDDTRIRAAIPTIQQAIKARAKIAIIAHLGRPGTTLTPNQTLAPIATRLQRLLNYPVRFCKHWFSTNHRLSTDYLTLYENVRLLPGETTNSQILAKQFANHCDIFIMDAFATIHRHHASTYGLAQHAPKAYLGQTVVRELKALDHILQQPPNTTTAIIGGAKISTKIPLLEALIAKVNTLIIGGGMANTFLKSQGYPIGTSIYEPTLLSLANTLYQSALSQGCQLLLPIDTIVATTCSPAATTRTCTRADIEPHEKILDIGPQTIQLFQTALTNAETIIWNGPMGVFEHAKFAQGTHALGTTISESNAYTIAGGGDTLAAIQRFNLASKLSHISTGGGAFLAYYSNPQLPILKLFT